jgi:hypothetical protein
MDIRRSDLPLFNKQEKADNKEGNSRQEAIFGFSDNNTTYSINEGLYGFAYYDPQMEEWYCFGGSFEYLYGMYSGMNMMLNPDETKGVHFSAFFVLDYTTQEPISIIPHAKLTSEQVEHMEGNGGRDVTYRDLIIMGEKTTPPKLEFEI